MNSSESTTTAAQNWRYEFGDFRLDATKRLLRRRDGTAIPLTPRVFDTLLCMIEHPDTVLDKERLMAAVWPDSIVEENNLTQNISTLRKVFGERPGTHHFIVTVPGRGYRFVAPVRAVDPEVAEKAPNESATEEPKRESSAGDEKDSVDSNRQALGAPGRTRFRPAVVALAAASLLIAVATGLWLQRASRSDTHSSSIPVDKSIAVLPFANLSDDKQNSYFAAAVQDEILTDLAKIADLKVISRMSANAYPVDQPRNAREIGRQLGVAHLLEGSVQRVGERIRVHAQLIDARTDSHVWAQSYDRELVDVFALQREIATTIAQQLQARLTTAPPPIASGKPTENPQAYLLYLRARELELADADYHQVSDVYRQAIRLDPKFALARSAFSIYLTLIVNNRADAPLASEARTEAEEALRLRPELGEAHLAMAYWYLYGMHDNDRASAEVARAGQLLPNSAEVPLLTAFICKTQNKFRERIAALRRADALDPRNTRVHAFLVLTYRWLRQWPEAIQSWEERRILAGNDPGAASRWGVANDEFQLTGEIGVLKKAIGQDATAAVPPEQVNYERFAVAMLERDYPAAAKFLAEVPSKLLSDRSGVPSHPKAFQAVMLAVARNADPASKADALSEGESAVRADDTSYASMHRTADLALIYAFAGRKEEAIREASSSIETASSTFSLVEKNDMSAALAAVYAQTAEPEKAIDLIEHLLTVPVEVQHGAVYNMTLTDLKWCWIWDPLRNHPRFQKILAGPEPKTLY